MKLPMGEIPSIPENINHRTDAESGIVGNSEKTQEKIATNFKETGEKMPELENKNFKIESTKRKAIKDQDGVKAKVNPEGDVWEYNGEQLFTKESAIREAKKAGKKLPASSKIYDDMIQKKYKGNYQDFLIGENMLFAGWYGPKSKCFLHIHDAFGIRCADGSSFKGLKNTHYTLGTGYNTQSGFSVRCIAE